MPTTLPVTPASAAASSPEDASPYIGLAFYTEDKAEFFFGREQERQVLMGNLRAARLTLLYAESGVGKSSLLRAGVAARLDQIARANLAHGQSVQIPVVFSAWKDDPIDDLITEIERTMASYLPEAPPVLPRESLTDAIRAATDAMDRAVARAADEDEEELHGACTLLLILDQFEEYFLYGARERSPGRLADELAGALNRPGVAANFLIAVREDAYSELGNLLRGRMSNVYGNYVHLDYMGASSAREAIEGPVARYNERHANGSRMEIEPGLVDALLEQVRRDDQQPQNGDGHPLSADAEIETPYLQLVMATLWERERAKDSHVLRVSTLEELQGARQIVAAHLAAALAALPQRQRDAAVDALHHLVTPSGTKIALEVSDLAEYTGRSVAEIVPVLEGLDEARILRPIPPAPGKSATDPASQRYEIYHDVLAKPINDTVSAQGLTRARRRLIRARRIAVGAGLLALLAVAGLIGTAVSLHGEQVAKKDARSSLIASRAEDQLNSDPELGALLAVRAYGIAHTRLADKALRDALPRLQLQRTLKVAPNPSSAVFSPSGDVIAVGTEDGVVHLWNAQDYRSSGTLGLPGLSAVNCVSFRRDGTAVLVGYGDGTARVWSLASHTQLGPVMNASAGGAIYGCVYAAHGTLVTGSADGAVRLWNLGADHARQTLGEVSSSALTGVAVSPDGSKVAASSLDGETRVWTLPGGAASGGPIASSNGSPVYSVAFSPDGRQLVTTSGGGQAEIWFTASHRSAGTLVPQQGWDILQAAVFSPSGKLIATAGLGAPLELWQAPRTVGQTETKPLRVLRTGSDTTGLGTAFDPTGKRVLTISADGIPRVWDTGHAKLLAALATGGSDVVNDVAFSPSGGTVATAGRAGGVTVWNAANGTALVHLALPNRADTTSIDFTGKGRYLLAAGDNGKSYVFETASGALIAETPNIASDSYLAAARFDPADPTQILTVGTDHVNGTSIARLWRLKVYASGKLIGSPMPEPGGGYVNNARFSPDGSEFVTADSNGRAYVWSTATRKALGAPITEPASAHNSTSLNSAAFSPDGGLLVTASDDGTARIWDASQLDHRLLATFTVPSHDAVLDAAISADGRTLIAAARSGGVYAWDIDSGRELLGLMGHGGAVNRVSLSSTGAEAVTASSDGTAKIWSTQPAGQQGAAIFGATLQDMVTSAFSPNGRVLAVSDADGTTSLWSTDASHKQIAVLREPGRAAVSSAEFDPHGTRLVTADSKGNAVIWNSSHQIVHILPNGSNDGLFSAVFSPDGHWIVTAGNDGVRVWNGSTFVVSRKIDAGNSLRWASVSPDSRLVVTGGQDGTVTIWDRSTGAQRYATITEPDQQAISDVWFSPSDLRLDGHFYPRDTVIVTASDDGTARIWNALTGSELRTVTEPGRSAIYNAVLSPDGRWLLTGSQDGTGRIWDVASGALLTTFYAGNPVSDIELSPHGDLVAMALQWGEARIFSTALAGPNRVLLAYAHAHLTRQLTPAEIREYVSGS